MSPTDPCSDGREMRSADLAERRDESTRTRTGADDYDSGSGSAGGAVDEAVAGFADAAEKERRCQERRMYWTRGR